jgi:hypothetical protein
VAGAEGLGPLGVREIVHDFGSVERGASVSHTFAVPNAGSSLLRLEHVKGSCGCTVAVVSDPDVPPGGEGRVNVTLDTSALAGRTTKVIMVYTSHPAVPTVRLGLTGEVVADLVVSPNALYLGRVRRGEAVEHEIAVVPGRPGGEYAVTAAVEHGNPALRARIEPRVDGPGQRVIVALDADVPLGRLSEQIVLRTTSPTTPHLTVPVFGSVEGDVVVLPRHVTLSAGQAGPLPEQEVYIRTRGGRRFAVTRVLVPDEVTYRLTPVADGAEYRLTLALRPGLEPGKVERTIEIFTDHPNDAHLVVPLSAIVPAGRRG